MFKKNESSPRTKRKPSVLEAFSTLIFMITMFGLGVVYSMNYVSLTVIVIAYTALLGYRCGYTWKEMEAAVGDRIGKSMPVIMILLAIGFMVGALMFSGTLPMLIYYGLKIVHPRWIALCAFLLCAIFSTATGTSNGSASTAGLAMMGLAMAMKDVNIGLVAGACYAGSIFGDKISPLSDTTVLASMITGNDIFDHIRHMAKTVVPAMLLSVVIYIALGLSASSVSEGHNESTLALLETLDSMFKWNPILFLPIVFILWGSLTRKNTTLILFGSGFIALFIGVFYQGFSFSDGINVLYSGFESDIVLTAHPNFNLEAMDPSAVKLLERGGISDMSKTFIMVMFCFYFAGIAELCGCLEVILDYLSKFVKGQGSLIFVTGIATVALIAVGGSSTVALLMGGTLFKTKYEEMGVDTLNLSRTLEDFGTGCSGFMPWTSSGILYQSVLFVPTTTLLQYSFFSWIVWILAITYGFSGKCMTYGRKKTSI